MHSRNKYKILIGKPKGKKTTGIHAFVEEPYQNGRQINKMQCCEIDPSEDFSILGRDAM
jgi:hypothetical protein